MKMSHLPAAAVAQALHDGINFCFEHFCQFSTVLVDTGCFTVVQPGVVEHEPHIVYVLPRLLVLTRVQLALDGGQVNGILHNVKVVLCGGGETFAWMSKSFLRILSNQNEGMSVYICGYLQGCPVTWGLQVV